MPRWRGVDGAMVKMGNLEDLVHKAEVEYNELRRFAGEKYPGGKCANIIELFHLLKTRRSTLIDIWLEWNEKRIHAHDFCMAFEKMFRTDIRERIKQKHTLKKKILRQMVREE